MKCTDRFANNYYLCTNQSNKVMVQAIYYPYGGSLSQSTNQGVQKFKYNGKEFDTMHGLTCTTTGHVSKTQLSECSRVWSLRKDPCRSCVLSDGHSFFTHFHYHLLTFSYLYTNIAYSRS